jgi:hypothetical protein
MHDHDEDWLGVLGVLGRRLVVVTVAAVVVLGTIGLLLDGWPGARTGAFWAVIGGFLGIPALLFALLDAGDRRDPGT